MTKMRTNLGDPAGLKKILAVNGDFFIRTLCLMTMTNIFVARGAGMGSDVLAANTILFQLQYLMASLFDGLANAASVFAGRSVGKDPLSVRRVFSCANSEMLFTF